MSSCKEYMARRLHAGPFMLRKSITTSLIFLAAIGGIFAYSRYATLRDAADAQAAGFVSVTEAAAETAAADGLDTGSLLHQVNAARGGLGALRTDRFLQNAAQRKAEDMARRGYFAHMDADGKTPWRWAEEEGYAYTGLGENLAVNFDTAEEVIREWLASPSHRANLLNGRYTETGIGIAVGEYAGSHDAVYVVEFYGQPEKTFAAGLYGLLSY